MKSRLVLPLVLFSLSALPLTIRAQWVIDGTPVVSRPGDQFTPAILSDGVGGAFVAWADYRSGSSDVYAQRLDPSGTAMWTSDGVAIGASANDQYGAALTSDGTGGVIIAWTDYRGTPYSDIYAQRIDASGAIQWTANGVQVEGAANEQATPQIISDGTGGAIIAWLDYRTGQARLYAQRINAAGVPQWATDGVLLCGVLFQGELVMTSDGTGGAVAGWTDYRTSQPDIYAQRINASGSVQWTSNGAAVCTATNAQFSPRIISDGAGGAVMTWSDQRGGTNFDIYAQRLNSFGVTQWANNGVAICTGNAGMSAPSLASDGAGGGVIAWSDSRAGVGGRVYAQRIKASGSVQWVSNGVTLCTAAGGQTAPMILAATNSAIAVWTDGRNGLSDLFAQSIDLSGELQWSDGVAVCTAANQQYEPVLAYDGNEGAIIAWSDLRTSGTDVYAQRVSPRFGDWGRPEPTLTDARDNPHDQGGKVILNWKASDRDRPNQQLITRYTIWRATDVVPAASSVAAGNVVLLDKPFTRAVPDGKRVVWHEQTAATDYYWELVGSQIAYYYTAYTYTASTRQDSTAATIATQYFRVAAEGSSQYFNWPSNVLSAHSVDNIAPPAPLLLTAQRSGANVNLKWNGVHVHDLDKYTVYRATSTGLTAIPANFLANDTDTVLTDASAPGTALYYIVTATDIHQNQGTKSNEASVAAATGVGGDLPPVTVLTVLQNHPNPFTGETQIQVGLPAREDVRVEIYDVAGRRVRNVLVPAQEKGWDTLRISARDDRGTALASGVYFFRVHAGKETVTRKMVIAR